MMGTYKKIVKRLNNAFVTIILFLVYFPAIGLCFALYSLTLLRSKKHPKDSFWLEGNPKQFTKNYFNSAY